MSLKNTIKVVAVILCLSSLSMYSSAIREQDGVSLAEDSFVEISSSSLSSESVFLETVRENRRWREGELEHVDSLILERQQRAAELDRASMLRDHLQQRISFLARHVLGVEQVSHEDISASATSLEHSSTVVREESLDHAHVSRAPVISNQNKSFWCCHGSLDDVAEK